jgi:hypothetical protein
MPYNGVRAPMKPMQAPQRRISASENPWVYIANIMNVRILLG